MPTSEELPSDLRMLAERNAFEVSDTRWDFDVGQLIKTLEGELKKDSIEDAVGSARRVLRLPSYRWLATVVVVVLLLGGSVTAWVYWQLAKPKVPRSENAVDGSASALPARLAAPTPLDPACGTTIKLPSDDYFLVFNWAPVSGASNYTVEVDCYGCGNTADWYSLTGSPWHIRSGLGFRSPIYSSKVHVEAGARPLRWRVWAVNSEGKAGEQNRWCQFAFYGNR